MRPVAFKIAGTTFRRGLVPDRLYGMLDGAAVQIRKHDRGRFRWTVVRNEHVQYPTMLGRGTTRREAIADARHTLALLAAGSAAIARLQRELT